MTWIIWSLLGILCWAIEHIVDKALIVNKEEKIDDIIASLIRNLWFYFFTVLVGVAWIFGELHFSFHYTLLIFAVLSVINSLIYSYFLKNTELSRYSNLSFIFPIFLIIIDSQLLHTEYSPKNITGALLLILWWFLISLDGNTMRKSKFSLRDLLLFLLSFVVGAIEFYTFKYFNTHHQLNEVSFFFSVWSFVVGFYIAIILVTWRIKKFFAIAKNDWFLMKTFVSKFFDTLSGVFILKATALATVAKVYVIESTTPVILFIAIFVTNKLFWINLKEELDTRNASLKLFSAILLSVGAYLVI